MALITPCPTCKKEISYSTDNPFRPFCSERCRQIDLGAWLEQDYSIPGAPAIDATDADNA